MEKRLIDKLSGVTDEERALLSGAPLDIGSYTAGGDSLINAVRVAGERPFISQRPHTRFAPFPLHGHNFVEMVAVIEGGLTHRIDGRELRLSAGDILIMNKHIRHSVDRAGEGDLGINFIMSDSFFDSLSAEIRGTVFEDFAKENSKERGEGVYLHFSSKGEKQIENILENLLFELTEYEKDNHILTNTVALLFKYLSLKERRLLVGAKKPISTEQKRKMEIINYLSANQSYATLTELSKKMGLSPPYLSRLIVSYFGKSFKELLLEERMRRAERLLTESDMPVGKIIYTLGYENESYFHTQFKKRYGKTPLNLRKEAEAKKEKK